MSYELLQRAGQYITPQFRRRMARAMQTEDGRILLALDRLLPALLLAMTEESRVTGPAFLLEEATHVSRSGLIDNLGTFYGSQGTFGPTRPEFMRRMLKALPGGGISGIASASGLSIDDTGTLAGLILPVCLLALRDVAGTEGDRGVQLSHYLDQQLPALQKAASAALPSY